LSQKVGIPRALMYHYYYPAWECFLKNLGMKVVLSPKTNKKILDEGVKIAVDDICLPFKVYYGHVKQLIKKVDYLFVPRFISLGKNNFVCPKFMGLPDMLKAIIDDLPTLIEPEVDLRKGIFPGRKVAHEIGRQLNQKFWKVERAYFKAKKSQQLYEKYLEKGFDPEEALRLIKNQDKRKNIISKNTETTQESRVHEKKLRIAVLGHAYIIYDHYISMNLVKHLKDRGVEVYTVEMFEPKILEEEARRQPKKVFWYFNRKVMGSAYKMIYNSQNINGIIQVTSFGCGPDSIIKELVDIKGKRQKVPILNICIDEHTGQAGLITRLEAFVDLLERREMA